MPLCWWYHNCPSVRPSVWPRVVISRHHVIWSSLQMAKSADWHRSDIDPALSCGIDAYSISWTFAIWNAIKGNDARAAKTTYFCCCKFAQWVVVWQGPMEEQCLYCMVFNLYKYIWDTKMLCQISVALLITRVCRNPGKLQLVQSFETIASTLVFSCDQAALWMVFSVRLSHLFDYVPIIVSSWNFQELSQRTRVRSMQKVKVRGQRSRSQRSQTNLTVSGL